jgi:2-polyprenyl-3-methyl-5-hydroxy-6-metoxy-1,4-benzoquinol methylase
MQNSAFLDKENSYYTFVNESLLPLIPERPNIVMDIGCATGRLGQKLLQAGNASELYGVEIFEPAANEAKKIYKRVHVGDIEEMKLDYKNYFDVVVCGDILEHLKEPSKVVSEIYSWLVKGGLIVCSVPNVRYWRIWRDLIFKGKWEYTIEGIMDHTHLRFFTLSSFRKMLIETSFEIEYQGLRIANGLKQRAFNRLTFGLFEEFFGIQMLFRGRKR